MAAAMIGVDPHKGSHTAVVISAAEEPPGEIRVRASAGQAQQLIAQSAGWGGPDLGRGGRRRTESPAGLAARRRR
jgi:hypothetical protein